MSGYNAWTGPSGYIDNPVGAARSARSWSGGVSRSEDLAPMPYKDPELRRANSREKQARYARSENGRETQRRYHQATRWRYGERDAAHHKVSHAIKAGTMIRLPCELCGSTRNVQGHHPFGYAGEFAMAVWWLCSIDHHAIHRDAP